MRFRTIGLSILGSMSLIGASLSTISCSHKQILLEDAVANKDFGHLTNLTSTKIWGKLFTLNPNLEIAEGELSVFLKHNRAVFSIHPAYERRSKYKGKLEVKFTSYIKPLFSEGDEINFTPEHPKHKIEFEITKDFPREKFGISGSSYEKFIELSEKRIEDIPNSEFQKLIIDFKLKPKIIETKRVLFRVYVEDANLPDIYFNVN